MHREHAQDPSALLEAAFRRIERERMADVPMLNAALQVEATGFSRHAGNWLGIVITPWFMNLVIVPGPGGAWERVQGEERLFRHFPAGSYAFLGNDEAEVGEFQSCSLISPMAGFPDQASARETAATALALLMQNAAAPKAASPEVAARDVPAKSQQRAVSKRDFLFGFLGT
jgi:[NiFe] hydrogenase assembly HybE family chaperone